MKKTILLLFYLQFVLALAQEQTIKTQFISTQKIDADKFVGFDGLDNLYYIKDNVLFKKNKIELRQYKNIYLGEITRVDLQYPLKIVLFYENFNAIIMLDNELSETQKINFSENSEPIIAAAAGNASQNKLWIYNSLSQQIGLFDYLNNNFQSITNSVQESFKYYDPNLNTFNWIDDKNNWYSCDIFGKISSVGKVPDFEQIQFVSSKVVIFSKNEKLYLQDLSKNSSYTIENVEKSFKNFYYKDQILSIFTNQEITNYKITIP